jgi:hypothetical protein
VVVDSDSDSTQAQDSALEDYVGVFMSSYD